MESTQKATEFSHLSDTVHPDQGTGEIGDPKPKAGGGVGSLAGGVSDSEAVLYADYSPEFLRLCISDPSAVGEIRAAWNRATNGGVVIGIPEPEQRVLEAPEGIAYGSGGAANVDMVTGDGDYRVWVAEPESSCMMAVYGRLAERWQG